MSTAPETRRVLVITNETAEGDVLHETIVVSAEEPGTEVLVVAPALNSRLRHWLSDSDAAHHAAELRLERCLDRLRSVGVRVEGEVGDADPLQAIEDALVWFRADELIVATHPPERSNWLEHDLVARACARFGLPVIHVVVDAARAVERLAA
jgi:hypothetical protein